MSKEIEIRIRPEWETEAARLVDWPADDVDGLLHLLSQWGVYDGEKVVTQLIGEFRLAPIPHFEIVLTYDE